MNATEPARSLDNDTRILVRGIATDKIHYDNLRSAVRVERCGEKLPQRHRSQAADPGLCHARAGRLAVAT